MTATHAVIAGTGRAGTSFLTQWLHASGVDAGLDDLAWHADARAGWERHLTDDPALPYLVKDPWLFTYCDQIDPAIIDLLIIPVRDLVDAARSRIHQEMKHLTDAERDAGIYGRTPGGMLHVIDQAHQEHVLAVGFHTLVTWAVEHDIPTVFLHHPRLVLDADYAVAKLAAIIPDADHAIAAHKRLADPRPR